MAATPGSPAFNGAFHMSNVSFADREPQRLNNFELTIHGVAGSEDLKLAVHSVSTPGISVDPMEVPYGNTRVKYAGNVTYNDLTCVFNDYVGKDIEDMLYDWACRIQNPVTQERGDAASYKYPATLAEYSGNYKLVRRWQCYGLFPTSMEFGEFAQDATDRRQINVTFSCDYAVRE